MRGLETEPERGRRCSVCFEYRFRRAARWARENGYDAVASVLGVSRHKDQSQVDTAGIQAVESATISMATPSQAMPDSPRPGGGNHSATPIPTAWAGGDGECHLGVAIIICNLC